MNNTLVDSSNRDIWALIQSRDRGRDSKIVSQKYKKMRKNAFGFFRGTCHLFYRDFPENSGLNLAPVVWICGDLHLENFGAYKGEDRQIYFGINDFDEGMAAPCTWDVSRLSTSIFLAVDSLSLDRSAGQKLVQVYLDNYAKALSTGKILPIVQNNAQGVVAELLENVHRRKRSKLLDERSELAGDLRQLKFDNKKVLKISKQQRELIGKVIRDWGETQANSDFFEVLDVGFRVAGTGSMGLDRYLILVVGKGSPSSNYLLDFKQQLTSSLPPYLLRIQPTWTNAATRVLQIQNLVQLEPPALLAAIEFNNSSYLLRELQPTQDKITLKKGEISLNQLEKLISTMAEITAGAHLHGSGKLGMAMSQDLINFGNNLDWQQEVLIYANNYAKQVQIDYEYFCKASKNL